MEYQFMIFENFELLLIQSLPQDMDLIDIRLRAAEVFQVGDEFYIFILRDNSSIIAVGRNIFQSVKTVFYESCSEYNSRIRI